MTTTRNDLAARRLYQRRGAGWLMEKAAPAYTDALLALVTRHIRRGDRILDVCCGYGRLTLPLLERGFDVRGIDIADTLVHKGRELLRAGDIADDRYLVANMRNLPFRAAEFDVTFCVWASLNFLVVEPEQLQAVQEMHRVLRPGATALIECPLHEAPGPVQTVHVDDLSYEYYPLTPIQLRALAARSSFLQADVFTETLAGRPRTIAVLRT